MASLLTRLVWSCATTGNTYGQNAPLPTPDQLDQLPAPIALYPDALVAQIWRHPPTRSRSSTSTTGCTGT